MSRTQHAWMNRTVHTSSISMVNIHDDWIMISYGHQLSQPLFSWLPSYAKLLSQKSRSPCTFGKATSSLILPATRSWNHKRIVEGKKTAKKQEAMTEIRRIEAPEVPTSDVTKTYQDTVWHTVCHRNIFFTGLLQKLIRSCDKLWQAVTSAGGAMAAMGCGRFRFFRSGLLSAQGNCNDRQFT